MAKKKSKPYRIDAGVTETQHTVSANAFSHNRDGFISVNLKYFRKNDECFSQWQKKELAAFSSWNEKMCKRTEPQITSTTQTCHAHVGVPLKLPPGVSPDMKMYSLDVGSKARVHGFFSGGQFFLVRLDRNHKVLK